MGLWIGTSRLVYLTNMNRKANMAEKKKIEIIRSEIKVQWGVWFEFYRHTHIIINPLIPNSIWIYNTE